MKNACYIGNFLPAGSHTPQICEILSELFSVKGIHIIKGGKYKSIFLRYLDMSLTLIWNRKKIELVLIDTFSGRAFLWAYTCGLLAKLLQIPYIPVLHGGKIPLYFKKKQRFIKLYLKNAHKIVCPSDYLYRWTETMGFSPEIIQNPIKIKAYIFKERPQFKAKLLWVRRYHAIYNPLMAVKILHHLQSRYPESTLTMAGPDGGEKKNCLDLSQSLGINEKCKFYDLLSKSDLIELTQQHDIFLNTTHYDNIPMTLIEMAAMGIPIVSTNAGGIPLVFEHEFSALLTNDNDFDLMTLSIIKLLKYPAKYQNMISNAKKITQNYSEDSVWSKWENLFSEV